MVYRQCHTRLPDRRMTTDDVVNHLLKMVVDFGAQDRLAEHLGITPQYLCDVLKRRRAPGDSILKALGLERVVIYRKKNANP